VGLHELSQWLPSKLMCLARVARARRILLEEVPEPPASSAQSGGILSSRLHAAEARFRETYLRSLLAQCGSRRKAAEHAGVPYRSFCEMLRKAGI
jgi:hypothetical protein